MNVKPPQIEIPPNEPYKNDLLHSRKQSGDILKQFVGNLREPFVLAIVSPWGTGKTTFLNMWRQSLTDEHFHSLYFNAWENDFSDSPLVSLIGEIESTIHGFPLTGEKKTKAEELLTKTKTLGASLVRTVLPTVIKVATANALGLTGLMNADLAKVAEDIAKQQIQKYESDKNTIKAFRKSLTELVANVSEGEAADNQKPVVFIIDDLDRCRPDYALELLEKVKHLFNVEGLVFVLAIDKGQLGEIARCRYGSGLNADAYLRRFIDLEYRLPNPRLEYYCSAMIQRLGVDQAILRHYESGKIDALRIILTKFFHLFDFSLREQEQLFSHLSVILRICEEGGSHIEILCFLLCLRTKNADLYSDIVKGIIEPEKIMNYLRSLPAALQVLDSHLALFLEAYLIGCFPRSMQEKHITRLSGGMAANGLGTDDAKMVRRIWDSISDEAATFRVRMIQRIELTQPFS